MPGSRDEWSRRSFLKRAGTAAAATGLFAGISPLLDACGNPATTSKGSSSVVKGGHLVEGVPSDPTTLNALMDTGTLAHIVIGTMYDRLLGYTSSGDLLPLIA